MNFWVLLKFRLEHGILILCLLQEAIFQDDNMPLSGSSLEFPIGVFDSCSNEMPNLYSVRDDAKYRSEVQRYFFNTKIYNIGHDSGDIWDGSFHYAPFLLFSPLFFPVWLVSCIWPTMYWRSSLNLLLHYC